MRSREEIDAFKAKHNVNTTPQIFAGDERIGGYTDLAEKLDVEVESEEEETSYVPVIAVFSTAGLMALATTLGHHWLYGLFFVLASYTQADGHRIFCPGI